MNRRSIGGYLLWVALVLLVAQLTGFRADAVRSINWAVAFMLTPFGLVQNLIFGANVYLHKFYFEATVSPSLAEQDRWYWHYLWIYAQSNLLEVIPLLFLWPRWRPCGQNFWRISVLNSITHPIVFFGLMRMPFPYLVNVLIAETFAVVTEWRAYKHLGLPSPFLSSLYANLISWQFAPALTVYFFLWEKLV